MTLQVCLLTVDLLRRRFDVKEKWLPVLTFRLLKICHYWIKICDDKFVSRDGVDHGNKVLKDC
jgi:hypothetical protein